MFPEDLKDGSARFIVFNELLKKNNSYLQHYVPLGEKYTSKKEVVEKYRMDVINKVRSLSINQSNYKYHLYATFNPTLEPLNVKIFTEKFVRLRLSSHTFPIETGRWSRTKRENRLCIKCNVLGDESHYIYNQWRFNVYNIHLHGKELSMVFHMDQFLALLFFLYLLMTFLITLIVIPNYLLMMYRSTLLCMMITLYQSCKQ